MPAQPPKSEAQIQRSEDAQTEFLRILIIISQTRSILCYGDSNTWGFDPATKGRHPRSIRWTGRLQEILGDNFHVIEEGLNGRTTIFTDPVAEYRNGKHLLPAILETHKPLDAVVLMLGTNDCKLVFHANPAWIARGASTLIELIRRHTEAQILLIAPAPIEGLTEFAEIFASGANVSHHLAVHFSRVALEQNVAFLDAGEHCKVSPIDGLHLDSAAHATLADAIAGALQEMLP